MKLKPLLVNSEHQDPVLLITIPQRAEHILVDLGYCFRLKVRDIQKISRIFVTHTHIDHFAGFDHILRLSLEHQKTITIYGPEGIISNVHGKLMGYTWNLSEGVNLNFEVVEVHPHKIVKKIFKGKEAFQDLRPEKVEKFNTNNYICITPNYKVKVAILDHKMPVLAYRIDAPPSFNADIEAMAKLNLSPGKWVGELKRSVENGNTTGYIEINEKRYEISQLASQIIKQTKGTSISYVVDTIYNKDTKKEILRLTKEADYFFCDAAYLSSEEDLALKNFHLTAEQVGILAKESKVSCVIPFHFSKRYEGKYNKIYEEVRKIFPHVKKGDRY